MNLRKNILLLPLFIFFLTGCNKELKKEAEQLKQDKLELQTQIDEQNRKIADFEDFITEINKELEASITDQAILEKMRGEENVNLKIKILTQEISKMLGLTQEELAAKVKELKNSRYRAYLLKKEVDKLKEQVAIKSDSINDFQAQILTMNQQLDEIEKQVRELELKNKHQLEKLTGLDDQLNTAAYIVGTSSELMEKGIIDKVGGLLGIFGRTEKLSPTFSGSRFTKIDIHESLSIGVNTRKLTLVTSHPKNSYTLKKEGNMITKIVITNPKEFWKANKYLVVMVK